MKCEMMPETFTSLFSCGSNMHVPKIPNMAATSCLTNDIALDAAGSAPELQCIVASTTVLFKVA